MQGRPIYKCYIVKIQFIYKALPLTRLSEFYEEDLEDTFGQSAALPDFEQLQLQNVSISLDNARMLSKFDLTVTKGEKILITGENGSGKTTLARLLVKIDSTECRTNHIQWHKLSGNYGDEVERAYSTCSRRSVYHSWRLLRKYLVCGRQHICS